MRADRLLSIILLLQTRGKMTAKALAEELEVSRRTILRDITALSFSGVPVYSEGGHGGGIALVEEYRTTLTGLNKFEVQSLFVANNHDALRDVGLGDAGERLLLKLLAALPNSHHSTADHIRQRLMIDPTWWWHDSSISPSWDDLQKAVYEDRLIEVEYENFDGKITQRLLAPIVWYVNRVCGIYWLNGIRNCVPIALPAYIRCACSISRFHAVPILTCQPIGAHRRKALKIYRPSIAVFYGFIPSGYRSLNG